MKFKKALFINIAEAALDKEYWQKLDALFERKVMLPKDSPDIIKELKDTDCLLSGFAIPITKEQIDAAPNLKYIGTLAIAFHKIDIKYARKKGIPVTNISGYCTDSVAEFVFAAILNELRQLDEGKRRVMAQNYEIGGMTAREIRGKTFGVLGLGNIGKRVAELAQGFGANVVYWSRHRKPESEAKGIKYVERDNLLRTADFISLNFAHTADTDKIINVAALKFIKPGAVVVNTAPVELVDINALAARLAHNDLTFVLDHSDEMSADDLKKLSAFKNCIIYPPIAFLSQEARINKQNLFISNIESFLAGQPVNVVNELGCY